MADVSERRFLNTKTKLESLNYHQPLGIESAPLVEKLLGDLIRTTENFQLLKQQSGKHNYESNFLHNQLEPLRKTNQRLIRENNQLHAEIIKKDELEAEREKKMGEKIRKTESENSELRFLNTQQTHRIKALEQEVAREKKRVEELLQRHIASFVTSTGETEELTTRAPTMELSSNLDPQNHNNDKQLLVTDPAMFDMLSLADNTIEKLNEQVRTLLKDKEILEEKERNFAKQIQIREREIMRLAKAVEAGSDPERLHLETVVEANNKTIQQLRLQLESFHKQANKGNSDHTKELQERITDLTNENERVNKRNEEVTTNHKAILAELRTAQQTLDELKEYKRSPQVNRKEVDKKAKEVTALKTELSKLQQDITTHKKQTEDMRSNVSTLEKENAAQQKLIATLEQQARDLTEMITAGKDNLTQALQASNEVKQLQLHVSSLQAEKHAAAEMLDKSEKEKFALLEVISGFENELAGIQEAIKQLTTDRDSITESYHSVSEELEDKMSMNKKLGQENAVLTARISALELRAQELAEDNQKLVSTIKTNVPQSPSQPPQSYYPSHSSPLSLPSQPLPRSLSAQTSPTQQQSNQHYQTLLRTMSAQADGLRSTNELLEQKVVEMTVQLDELHSQNNDELVKELETQVADLKNDLRALNDARLGDQAQISKLKEALLQADSTLTQMEASVSRTNRHTSAYNDTLQQLTNEVDVMRSEIKRKEAEIAEQKRIIERIDREKDSLLQQLDQKDEEVAELAGLKDAEVQSRERIVTSLTTANTQADKMTEMIATKDKEIFSLNAKVEGLMVEKIQMESELVHLHQELDLVTKDFMSLTRDNQSLHTTLDRERSEKESLNKDVREYCARVAYLEEHLKGKEMEREQLLEAYSGLGDENNKLVDSFKQAQTQIETLSGNAQTLSNEIDDMTTHIKEVEQENEHYVLDLQAFERQTENMSRRISELEKQLSIIGEDRDLNSKELLASRDYTVQLAQAKDTIVRELAQARQINDRQGMELESQNAKLQALNIQLEAEAKRIKDLESILKNETLKEAQIQIAHESNAHENERMKEEELTKTRRTVVTSNYEREAVYHDRKAMQSRCDELEKMVEDQQQVIQAMDEERTRFKGFVMKYETELNKSESRLSEILRQLFLTEQTVQRLENELKNKNEQLLLYRVNETPSPYPRSSPRPPHSSSHPSPFPPHPSHPSHPSHTSSHIPSMNGLPPTSVKKHFPEAKGGRAEEREEGRGEENEDSSGWSGYLSSRPPPPSIPLPPSSSSPSPASTPRHLPSSSSSPASTPRHTPSSFPLPSSSSSSPSPSPRQTPSSAPFQSPSPSASPRMTYA